MFVKPNDGKTGQHSVYFECWLNKQDVTWCNWALKVLRGGFIIFGQRFLKLHLHLLHLQKPREERGNEKMCRKSNEFPLEPRVKRHPPSCLHVADWRVGGSISHGVHLYVLQLGCSPASSLTAPQRYLHTPLQSFFMLSYVSRLLCVGQSFRF